MGTILFPDSTKKRTKSIITRNGFVIRHIVELVMLLRSAVSAAAAMAVHPIRSTFSTWTKGGGRIETGSRGDSSSHAEISRFKYAIWSSSNCYHRDMDAGIFA